MKWIKVKYFSFPLLLLVFLNIVPSVFLINLTFDNAPEVYLPADQPGVVLKNQLLKIFPGDQNAFILFKGNDLYSDQFLENLDAATRQLNRSDLIEKVISVTETEHIEGTEDGFEVSSLLGDEKRKEIKEAFKRFQYAQSDKIAKGLIISDQMTSMAIMVRPNGITTTAGRIAVMELVEKTLAEYNLNKYIAAKAGPIVVEIEQFRSMILDMMIFVPGTVLTGLILIWFMYKRLIAVVVAGLVTGAVVNSALFMYVIFSLPFTMITSILSPLLASLTMAFLIHFYNSMQLASSFKYQAKERVTYAVKHIKKPAFYTAITTILGLCSLSVSPILPIMHLGLVAAFGVLLISVLVLWVIPQIFLEFDNKTWDKESGKFTFLDKFIKLMVLFSIRRAGWVVSFFVVIFALGTPFIWNVSAETNLLKFFPDSHVVTHDTQLIETELSGVMPLEVIFYGDSRDSLKKFRNLEKIDEIQSWLEKQPEINKTTSVVNFIKDMHLSFNQYDPQIEPLPGNNQLISQYFFIYDGNDVYELVNREFDQTRIVLSLHEHNSSKIREVIARIKKYLDSNVTEMRWDIAGEGRLFAEQDKLLIDGQLYSLIAAVFLISLMMFFLWKNLMDVCLTMLPNLSPVLGIFIMMGIFGIWLDMATALIASVAIGIAVDDTIHVFYDFKRRIKRGEAFVFALAQSFCKTGRALVVTTIILCSQFLLVSCSESIPTSYFGLLTAFGLFMALIFDLLLLPAMLVLMRSRYANQRPAGE